MITFDQAELNKTKRRRLRKVYYGHYNHGSTLRHPVIRLGGKYLKEFGFEVGDRIEVWLEHNQITIKKQSESKA